MLELLELKDTLSTEKYSLLELIQLSDELERILFRNTRISCVVMCQTVQQFQKNSTASKRKNWLETLN